MTARFYLVHVELALTSGQFPVAGGELSDEVVAADKQNIPRLAQHREAGLKGRGNNWAYLPSLSQS